MIESSLLENTSGYINGHWVAADNNKTFAVSNPASGTKLADVPYMGQAETKRAITAAKKSLSFIPDVVTRQNWLQQISAALKKDRKEIGRILCLEHGKPWPEAQAEVDYAASFFDYYAQNMQQVLEPEVVADNVKGCSWTVYRRPIGVVGLITPWNFPIAMIAKKIAPALAAGCPSIIKPASETPLTMIALFKIMTAIEGMPKGMINLVMGSSSQIGNALMDSRDVTMISFTGSTAVGQQLIEQSAQHVKKLGLELGGNAPFIVFGDADLDSAADGLMANKFRGSGQTCVCANRIYVHSSIYEEFANKVVERVEKLVVGDGLAAGTDIGPVINANGYAKIKGHLADALNKGADLLTGKLPEELNASESLFFTPAVISNVTDDMDCCNEETFGPLIPLIKFDDADEVIARANNTEYGLAAYVFCKDKDISSKVIASLHFGHCGHNTGTGPAAIAPFGGMLSSGIGREGGADGLLEYIELQTVPSSNS